MAIEQGIVALVQAALDGYQSAVPGGFFVQLPKDLISDTTPAAWTYRVIVSDPDYTLSGPEGFVRMEIQIDSHGQMPSDVTKLAAAIDLALSGYNGILADEDATVVQGIFSQGRAHDGFSDVNRTYVRSNDYEILYAQP